MGGSSMVVHIERKSSIEKEPLTLHFDQIQFARDAALSVMKTRGTEEALRIFTEGLEPIVSGAMKNGDALMDLEEEWINELRIPGPRDIVSAPF
ncbi:uncharacterized protein LOC132267378 [Cornus florida]|uniref:uncharacterized protein LOC132267378 n=1 Tax=Cornus florida TaxID=4283 RepID=UPI0028964C0E|nr:uncharacterized protein LOC132267378 [Cornus florida]